MKRKTADGRTGSSTLIPAMLLDFVDRLFHGRRVVRNFQWVLFPDLDELLS